MAVVRNIVVRAGADVNPLQKGLSKGQQAVRQFSSGARNSMRGMQSSMRSATRGMSMQMEVMSGALSMGKTALLALGAAAVAAGVAVSVSASKMAMEYEASIQQVNRILGANSAEFTKWVNNQAIDFNMAKSEAMKYGAVYGNLISGIAKDQKEATDLTIQLLKQSAVVASGTSRDMTDVMDRIRSGLLGNTEAIEDLGINVNVAMLESTKAFQQFANGKSWNQLSFQTQQQIRLNAILEQSIRKYGTELNQNTAAGLTKFTALLKNAQLNLGQAFLPLINAVTPILIQFASTLEYVTGVFAQFMKALFGVEVQQAKTQSTAIDAAGAENKLGNATGKAAKKAKQSVMAFDEVNQIQEDLAENAEDAADALSAGGTPASMSAPDMSAAIPSGISAAADELKRKIAEIQDAIAAFYNNWGIKDIFDGIKRGVNSFDFMPLITAFSNIGNQLAAILIASIPALQAVSKSIGAMVGSAIAGAITAALTVLGLLTSGISQFMTENSGSIVAFIYNVSNGFTTGFNNLKATIDSVFGLVIGALNERKVEISNSISNLAKALWEIAKTVGIIITDMFAIATGKIALWTVQQRDSISATLSNILSVFTLALNTLSTITTGLLTIIKEWWDQWGKDIFASFTTAILGLVSWAQGTFDAMILPMWKTLMVEIKKIWDGGLGSLLTSLTGFIGRLASIALEVWNKFLFPILTFFKDLFEPQLAAHISSIIKIIGTLVSDLLRIASDIYKILNGIIDFITGVFMLNWAKAWNGVKDVFKSIVGLLVDIFKVPLNAIIGLINMFIAKLNAIKIDIPSVDLPGVGRVGGGSVGFPQIPEIPKLARGGMVSSPTLAQIGEAGAEAVIPLENSGFVDTFASAIGNAVMTALQFAQIGSAGNQGSGNEIVMQIDGTQIARALIPYINKENDRIGNAVIQGV